MTNPFMPQQPAAPVPAPGAPTNPFMPQQPAAPAVQQQYQAPAQNGGSPWPQGAVAAPSAQAATNLVARPGGYSTPPPPSASNGGGPRIADLQSRLLLILPESIQRGIASRFAGRDGQAQTQDKLTATVIVLDGGPLHWTPKVNGVQQAPQATNVPHVIKGLWIQQTKLIEQLEEPLAMRQRGEPGLALGRLWKAGPGANDPYVLAAPTPQDGALYDQYVASVNPFTL